MNTGPSLFSLAVNVRRDFNPSCLCEMMLFQTDINLLAKRSTDNILQLFHTYAFQYVKHCTHVCTVYIWDVNFFSLIICHMLKRDALVCYLLCYLSHFYSNYITHITFSFIILTLKYFGHLCRTFLDASCHTLSHLTEGDLQFIPSENNQEVSVM